MLSSMATCVARKPWIMFPRFMRAGLNIEAWPGAEGSLFPKPRLRDPSVATDGAFDARSLCQGSTCASSPPTAGKGRAMPRFSYAAEAGDHQKKVGIQMSLYPHALFSRTKMVTVNKTSVSNPNLSRCRRPFGLSCCACFCHAVSLLARFCQTHPRFCLR